MPFTPAHAIVAIPFARTPVPAGAVAIGAMAPDLPLFFPWLGSYAATHGVPSLLWTAMPTAVVLYLVWRLAIRPAASGLLPGRLASRLPVEWDRADVRDGRHPVAAALLVVAAALLGVATHVFWDGFTHAGRFGADWLPIIAMQWGPLTGTQWLQYASSALGLAGIAVWTIVALRRAETTERRDPAAVRRVRLVAWWTAVAILIGSAALSLALEGVPSGYRDTADQVFHAGTRAGAFILVDALIASLLVQWLRRRTRTPSVESQGTQAPDRRVV